LVGLSRRFSNFSPETRRTFELWLQRLSLLLNRILGERGFEPTDVRNFKDLAGMRGCQKRRKTWSGTAIVPWLFPRKQLVCAVN